MAFDLRNFIFHSGYPIDKVVGMKSGTINMPNSTTNTYTTSVAHGLPFTPLPIGQWSIYSDFRDCKDAFYPIYGNPDILKVEVRTNSTNVTVFGTNRSGTSRLVYWRVVFLEPSNSNADVPMTVQSADTFQLNTKYNYSKLIKEGYTTTNTTVAHNMGFIPQTLIWEVTSSGTRIASSAEPDSAVGQPQTSTIDTSNLYLRRNSGVTALHYRMYGDD